MGMYENHHISRRDGYTLFIWWHERNGKNIRLTAYTLGVSERTAQRWIHKSGIPLSVAAMLDQLRNGPALPLGHYRGHTFCRTDWKPALFCFFNQPVHVKRESAAAPLTPVYEEPAD